MNKFNLINCLAFAIWGNLCTYAQTENSSAYDVAVEKQKSVPVTATLFINEFPSKKEQFTDDWSTGNIYYTNGSISENCKLRYNCWKDELIWLRETDFKTGTVIKSSVKAFNFSGSGQSKHFNKFTDDKSLLKQVIYLEVLTEGSISLYCHRKVSYIKSSNTFTNNHQYYLKINGEMTKVKIRKSDLLKHLAEVQQKKIKTILRENHLKFKDEYDLAKAFDMYNASLE